jgi:hypothetical protein
MPFLGQSTDRLQFLQLLFVDEGEKLQCSHVTEGGLGKLLISKASSFQSM